MAIASVRNACAAFRRIFEGPEFAPLKAQGGRVQRLLWASVSTRNPHDPDTKYTDELIGPETISAMPRPTYDAFKDHGRAAPTLLDGDADADADRTLKTLADAGIDFQEVTDRLLKDGVAHLTESYRTLLQAIGEKRSEIIRECRIGRTERCSERTPRRSRRRSRGSSRNVWSHGSGTKTRPSGRRTPVTSGPFGTRSAGSG